MVRGARDHAKEQWYAERVTTKRRPQCVGRDTERESQRKVRGAGDRTPMRANEHLEFAARRNTAVKYYYGPLHASETAAVLDA